MFIRLTDDFHVAQQISAADVAQAQAQGMKRLINNRPDGEMSGQPTSADMEAAAHAAGMDYLYIPITPGQFTPEQVAQMQAALQDAKPTLAFCRTGTRSTLLWALAQAAEGADYAQVSQIARQGGYDISAIAPIYNAISAQRST